MFGVLAGIDNPVILLILVCAALPMGFVLRLTWVLVNARTTAIETLQSEKVQLAEDAGAERSVSLALRQVRELERDAYIEHLQDLEGRNATLHKRLLALEGGPPRDLLEAVEADQVRIVHLLGDTPSGPPE